MKTRRGQLVMAVLNVYVACACAVGLDPSVPDDRHDKDSWQGARVNMTLFHDKCESGCKEYLLPGRGTCYNAQQLFPGDRQWGVYDVRDVCTKVNNFYGAMFHAVNTVKHRI